MDQWDSTLNVIKCRWIAFLTFVMKKNQRNDRNQRKRNTTTFFFSFTLCNCFSSVRRLAQHYTKYEARAQVFARLYAKHHSMNDQSLTVSFEVILYFQCVFCLRLLRRCSWTFPCNFCNYYSCRPFSSCVNRIDHRSLLSFRGSAYFNVCCTTNRLATSEIAGKQKQHQTPNRRLRCDRYRRALGVWHMAQDFKCERTRLLTGTIAESVFI